MWTIKVLLIFVSSVIFCVSAEDAAPKEGGIFATCPLTLYDLTLSSTSTDSMKLYLVVGNTGDHHVYNISRAASVINDDAFRKDYRTVIYIHGFNDKPGRFTSTRIVEGYQIRGRHNILLLDLNWLMTLEYFRASRSTYYAGTRLGKVLSQMYKSGFNMDTLDIVAHSLGSHMAAFAGKSYRKATGKLLPRIVALDPAAPCFKGLNPDQRLSKEDAEFVQVLHSNGGELGLKIPVGHVDFYLNGGSRQPPSLGISCMLACSHDRVIDVWKNSVIYPNKFFGAQCMNMREVDQDQCFKKGRKTIAMGPTADPKARGMYYVRTSNRDPFYLEPEEMTMMTRRRVFC